MKSLITIAGALLLAVAFALPAYAEDGSGGKGKKGRCKGGKAFAKFDKDGSGTLTSDEVPAKLWTRLVKADSDGDGAVSKAEAKAAKKKRKGRKGRRGKRGGKKGGSSSDA